MSPLYVCPLTWNIDIETAKLLLGPNAIIGITCSNLEEARAATKAGASYLGIGTVFATPTYVGPGLLAIRGINTSKARRTLSLLLGFTVHEQSWKAFQLWRNE